MDRLRAGLAGLGVVFILTLGTSLAFAPDDTGEAVAAVPKEPNEPLAQLGVAPNAEKSSDRGAGASPDAASDPLPVVPEFPPLEQSPVLGWDGTPRDAVATVEI